MFTACGEALPSIAAVAQVICISRTTDAATSVELRIAGGEVQAITPRGGTVGTTFTVRNLFYNIPVACHTSVRPGQTLSLVEQQALIDQLSGCEGPRTCPHGRPTLIVITKHQLERQFGRLDA